MPMATPVESKKSDLLREIEEKGFTIVKGVIPKERCKEYITRMEDRLESYELGYSRSDPSTWEMDNIPFGKRGGLYNNYQVGHLQFAWDIRMEPSVIKGKAHTPASSPSICDCTDPAVNKTVVKSLQRHLGNRRASHKFCLLSLPQDAINISLPLDKQGEPPRQKPWPHQDQSPNKQHLWCVQGIANLSPNGPLDGGLMVLKGSLALNEELFKEFAHLKPDGGWKDIDSYHYTDEQMAWFEQKGCVWEKVCADPGDIILWDSRTCHYGGAPKYGGGRRFATYICMVRKSFATEKELKAKRDAFEHVITTTHAPFGFRLPDNEDPGPDRGNGKPDHAWPKYKQLMKDYKPVLNERGLQLAGMLPY